MKHKINFQKFTRDERTAVISIIKHRKDIEGIDTMSILQGKPMSISAKHINSICLGLDNLLTYSSSDNIQKIYTMESRESVKTALEKIDSSVSHL